MEKLLPVAVIIINKKKKKNGRELFLLARNLVYILAQIRSHQHLVSRRHSNGCHAKEKEISKGDSYCSKNQFH